MVNPAALRDTEISLDQRSDDVIITLFQSGEEHVFRYLVDRYKERVRNLIFSIFNDASVVDDIAQEVFIRVYEALPKFRFESSFYTWLYRITVNRSRDEMRKKRMRRFFSLQTMLEAPSEELLSKVAVVPKDTHAEEVVSKALEQLPEKFRIPLVLKDIDGLSYEEMAETFLSFWGTSCEKRSLSSRCLPCQLGFPPINSRNQSRESHRYLSGISISNEKIFQ